MPAKTYNCIATSTLSSPQTSVTFSSISASFTDLVLVVNNIIASGLDNDTGLQFNGDTGFNYSNTYFLGTGGGTGGSVITGRATNLNYADCGYLGGTNSGNPNTRIINIMNYSTANGNKMTLSRGAGFNGSQTIGYVNLWRSNSVINSIRVFSASGRTYATNSTFTLYGIKCE